ncbi:MAG TPA: enoyl-CoA hydratase-related protein [Acidimicrobiales bacterium]|nr:enoyl-CoA hydratase-related protein [Acidimicrobiales bacterium]
MGCSLSVEGDVRVIDLGDGENRLDRDAIAALHRVLDEVEAAPAPRAIVTTATGKFWCNGFDTEWIAGHPDEVDGLFDDFRGLMSRLMLLPVPSVAAIQGHAFAAGAMLAFGHDFRVMREDRGYFCLPEIDLKRPLSAPSVAVVRAKVSPSLLPELLIAARRYSGPDALAAGIVHAVAPGDGVRAAATELAGSLAGKDPASLGVVKQRIYAPPGG